MKLLVTRPETDSKAVAEALAALGHEAVVAPLLTIRFLDGVDLPKRTWQAILVTSANGARALGRRDDAAGLKKLPVFTVGQASAEAMARGGFTEIAAAEGDVDSLAALVAARLSPEAGPLLHAAGRVVAGDLKSDLEARGFEVDRIGLYEALKADRLPEAVCDAFEAGEIGGVLLYSPRTARIFAALAVAAGLEAGLSGVTAYCLSPAVADALSGLPLLTVKVAQRPEESALFALLPG